MSSRDTLPEIEERDGKLVITIGLDALIDITTAQPEWPSKDDGEPYKVVDRELFIKDFIKELQREEEDGATILHRAFDQSAINLFEDGSYSVEMDD